MMNTGEEKQFIKGIEFCFRTIGMEHDNIS